MIIDLRKNGLAALSGGRESLLTFSFIFLFAKITRGIMRREEVPKQIEIVS